MTTPGPDAIRKYLRTVQAGTAVREGLIPAAVLIPLIPAGTEYEFLFTERSRAVGHHKGQISFPGGVCDPPDEDPVCAALREMEEEVGIPASCVQVLGRLREFWTPTGFRIIPIVGLLETVPPLRIQANEVASVFTVPFSFFSNPAHVRIEKKVVEGVGRDVYFYDYGSFTIWGATAMMVREFLRMIGCGEK